MDHTGTPPSTAMEPVPPVQTSTPNTSVSFRNVRPLQTAFKTNGLVSKKRRSLGSDLSLSDICRPGNETDARGLEPMRSAPLLSVSQAATDEPPAMARPLREVVEAAMANRSFNVACPQHAATMPDTPMKPSLAMSSAATTVRMHRRGRSMGGAFPPRSPLFLSSQRSLPVSMQPLAPQSEMRPTHGRMHVRRSRHMRSVSERIAMPRDLFSLDPPKRPEDPDDVFDSPNKSPIRPMPDADMQDSLPALRSEQPAQSSRCTGFAPVGLAQGDRSFEEVPRPASPLESGLSDSGPSSMDSPNNVFSARASQPRQSTPRWHANDSPPEPLPFDASSIARPLRDYTRAWVENTPTGARETGALLSIQRGSDELLEGSPNTPTRKHMKWFEAAQSPLPQKMFKDKARPRHSQPAHFSTPARPSLHVLGHSAPAARHRESRMSQFEEHFVVEGVLGAGEFSEVVKVREKATGYVSAVKRMKRPFLGPKDRVRRLEEVDVMCMLKQRRSTWPTAWFGAEGVVDLLDAWEEEGFLFIQTELCPLGSLAFVLAEYGRQVGALDEARLWKVLAELSAGIDFIHRCGVLHLDLKPANVLITEVGTLKITDFGMATRWPRCTAQEVLAGAHLETLKFVPHDLSDTSQSPPLQGMVPSAATVQRPRRRTMRGRHTSPVMALEREGDREYIAPEVIFESKYGKPADIFSLGLIMLEAACSVELPDNGEPWHKLRCNDFSDVSLDSLSPAMQSMITSMLQSEPTMRPTAAEIVDMPSLAAVRAWMCRGLQATELDQLPSLGSDSPAPPSPYPLPPSKYYEPPHNGMLEPDRTVVRIRGSMIQEDEVAFLAEILQAADTRDTSSPDTSASLMTEDSIQPEAPGLSPVVQSYTPMLLSHSGACVDDPVSTGMDIDKALPLDRSM
ncbi:non-specific serine/threonine protein kinase [Malassezia caprae]|uniref:Non-specific serine/threonine protein kinase n=1 Tax=Malassezia caprae TaxID=1381934 RepID=A0AAF0E6V3_9BASI|nr:non-specific serine/threonine protein kinase [Malassezia caprae]